MLALVHAMHSTAPLPVRIRAAPRAAAAPRVLSRSPTAMPALRFHVPPEQALLTLADASGGLSALFALDRHAEHHVAWLTEASEAFGHAPYGDDEMKDARAVANAQTETIRALRTELAELAADAEAQLPGDVATTSRSSPTSRCRSCPTRLVLVSYAMSRRASSAASVPICWQQPSHSGPWRSDLRVRRRGVPGACRADRSVRRRHARRRRRRDLSAAG